MNESKTTNQTRFANLDGLRFIAAMLVVINHIEQISDMLGLDSFIGYKGVEQIGKFGVMLFFSLSGFLITYLLLKEKETTGTINIKSFYLRRMLRIWPLYIVVILLAFFFFHYFYIFDLKNGDKSVFFDNLGLKLLFYFFMLPNLVLLVFGAVPFASQAWSIGSEEQFYIIWPLILKRIKVTIFSLLGVILFYHLFIYFFQNYVRSNVYREYCVALMHTVPLDLMALGGIVAVMNYKKERAYQFLYKALGKTWVQILLMLCLLTLLVTGYRFTYYNYFFYGLFMAALVFTLSRGRSYAVLESKVFKFGGKISYGIYMWHGPVVTMVLKLLVLAGFYNKLLAYPLIIVLTLLVAWISFKLLETPFLRLKQKYSIVP
jgi:peptidoglycan/LPS O-acetylase OafA/YrhL